MRFASVNRRYIFIETGILHPWTSCLFCLGCMIFDDVQDSCRVMYKGTICHWSKDTRIEILRGLEHCYVDLPVSFQIEIPVDDSVANEMSVKVQT